MESKEEFQNKTDESIVETDIHRVVENIEQNQSKENENHTMKENAVPNKSENKSEKHSKGKKQSIFRRSKKSEKNNTSFEIENVEGQTKDDTVVSELDTSKNESENSSELSNDKEVRGKERSLKKIWKRKSSKKIDVVVVENDDKEKNTLEENSRCEDDDGGHADIESPNEKDSGKKERKRSFINRLKKLNRLSKSVEETVEESRGFEEESAPAEEKKVDVSSTEDKNKVDVLSTEDENCKEDSFHDIQMDKQQVEETDVKPVLHCDDHQDYAESINGGVYVGAEIVENESLLDNTAETSNESGETDLTDLTSVTALPDGCTSHQNSSKIESEITGNQCAKIEYGILGSNQGNQKNKSSDQNHGEESTTEECGESSFTTTKENTEPKNLDFVLVDHLNDKQKDESYILAKKAFKVYKKAQLSNTYCQACCTVM